MEKGCVCVTGGTGYLASWMIKRLIEEGYLVNTTVRSNSGSMKDVSYLKALPGASKRLKIFESDLSKPETFEAPIRGCIGVFHVAHPIDFVGKEPEEVITERAIKGSLGILQACIDSKTVKKLVYTSSACAVVLNGKNTNDVLDEDCWSDFEYIRTCHKEFGASYFISKTMTEKATLEFAEKKEFDVVTVIPTYIHGPFVGPHCPNSVRVSMAMIFGETDNYKLLRKTAFVHVDDLARAHIHLFECPNAKGRYICSKIEVTIEELYKLLSTKYPKYNISNIEFLIDAQKMEFPSVSSKKLLGTGFEFKYGLEEMFDDAIECCKQKNIL
ncbi:vestitone reductase isoform X1 [Lactuca sativa]|uniref:vestitone reductase isoform X1 n=2 Tax=Lactuca sativa TaxID=4236 RepID=UPI000CD8FA96|nr:vestitone reductase isoform X1 [Lactuca sativa]